MSDETQKKYVVGFMFTKDGKSVVLIEKQKPDWQKGCLNGVGGKIEGTEWSEDAMIREFREETGVHHTAWHQFCHLKLEGGGSVYCYRAFSDDSFQRAETKEAEKIGKFAVSDLTILNTIENLQWLIPMALDPNKIYTEVQYLPGEGFR